MRSLDGLNEILEEWIPWTTALLAKEAREKNDTESLKRWGWSKHHIMERGWWPRWSHFIHSSIHSVVTEWWIRQLRSGWHFSKMIGCPEERGWGTSLVVPGLRLCAPKSGGPYLIPGQGTRSHMLQLRPSRDKYGQGSLAGVQAAVASAQDHWGSL